MLFFKQWHNKSSSAEYCFGLGKWLYANLGEKVTSQGYRDSWCETFKEKET